MVEIDKQESKENELNRFLSALIELQTMQIEYHESLKRKKHE